MKRCVAQTINSMPGAKFLHFSLKFLQDLMRGFQVLTVFLQLFGRVFDLAILQSDFTIHGDHIEL